MSQSSRIRIVGAELFAHHGVTDDERAKGGLYGFDIDIETDITNAAASDNLPDALDYESVYHLARGIMEGPPRHLLETLSVAIANAILERYTSAKSVRVCVRKLSVPISGKIAAVEVEYVGARSREPGASKKVES